MREKLIKDLRNKTEDDFFTPFAFIGETIDPYSGYSHTMFNYIAGFI